MPDTRSIIESSISSIRQDGPADGGPEPDIQADTTDAADTGAAADDAPVREPDDIPDDPDVPAKVTEPATEPAKKPEEKVENDDVNAEPEFTTGKDGRKLVNRIPQPRVKAMVDKAVTKAVEAAKAAHTTEVAEYKTKIGSYDNLGAIMEHDADRFMAMIAEINPRYK